MFNNVKLSCYEKEFANSAGGVIGKILAVE